MIALNAKHLAALSAIASTDDGDAPALRGVQITATGESVRLRACDGRAALTISREASVSRADLVIGRDEVGLLIKAGDAMAIDYTGPGPVVASPWIDNRKRGDTTIKFGAVPAVDYPEVADVNHADAVEILVDTLALSRLLGVIARLASDPGVRCVSLLRVSAAGVTISDQTRTDGGAIIEGWTAALPDASGTQRPLVDPTTQGTLL